MLFLLLKNAKDSSLAESSCLMQLELFFKVGYVCTLPKGVERNRIVLSLQA